MHDFDEYERLGEPGKLEKSETWKAAIGLQGADGLKPSQYLIETAKKNIEGDVTFDEVKELLQNYYKANPEKAGKPDRIEEADKVSAHIAEILSEKTFTFSPAEYITIHKRLFTDIYDFAGKIRDYNISKAEWVLNGETVYYASADSIQATLDYDFLQEKAFNYKGLSKEQSVQRIAKFVSDLWQIHPFGEGNTRTTAVFAIKYLRILGFTAANDLFTEKSWYFRNALVRANYNDYKNGIYSTMEYLYRFFGNLLLGEKNILKSRDLRIKTENEYDTVKSSIDTVKHLSDTAKPPIDTVKHLSDTVNDTVKHLSDIVSDTVKHPSDTAKPPIDTVKHLSDTVNDTVKSSIDTVKYLSDTVNDTVKSSIDTVKYLSDTVNDTVKLPIDTVKHPSDTVKLPIDTVKHSFDTVSDTLISLIKMEPHITAAAIADKTGLGIATVKRHIKKLKDSAVIERIGSDKTGCWKVLKD
ncbi:MAG: Fic family protein [Chitinispirillales bacterium]|jgi:fido (protein-threonine AMPylation protein)/gas vesicle protein|nr:Fic family protein [Chitinispirillales bacterium]